MSTPTLTILIGPPCSGKTTWARDKGVGIIVSRDNMRDSIFTGYTFSKKNEEIVSEAVEASVLAALSKGQDVVLDNTHCKKEYIHDAIDKYNYLANIEFECDRFNIDMEELRRRNKVRADETGKEIPDDVIVSMKERYDKLATQGWNDVKLSKNERDVPYKIDLSETLPSAIIFDLDGTLSHSPHRAHFGFNPSEVLEDKIHTPIAWMLMSLLQSEATTFFLSGREDTCYDETKQWIQYNFINHCNTLPKWELHMRKKGDYRRDSKIKLEMFNEYIEGKYSPMMVFDDRRQVIREVWNKLGIYTFDVGQGKNWF